MEKLIVPFGFSCQNILLPAIFYDLFEVHKPEPLLYKHFKLLVTPSGLRFQKGGFGNLLANWQGASTHNSLQSIKVYDAHRIVALTIA